MGEPVIEQNRQFLIRLCLLVQSGIGLAGRRQVWAYLQAHYNEHLTLQSLFEIVTCSAEQQDQIMNQWQGRALADRVQHHLQTCKVTTILDDDYPRYLRELYAAPLVLFSRGNWRLAQTPGLAIVGSRKASPYAYTVLNQWLPTLVNRQLPIISGLAAGVDALSHQQALMNHGATVAVIGTGLDVAYPAANRSLQQRLTREQLVISEYPLKTPPARFRFPERNRIIAGLSQAILVVEAAARSGSLITANIGLQENRTILAVPGRITDPMSAGCNALIAAGAVPVTCAADVLLTLQNEP